MNGEDRASLADLRVRLEKRKKKKISIEIQMSVLEWQPILNPTILFLYSNMFFINEHLLVEVISKY